MKTNIKHNICNALLCILAIFLTAGIFSGCEKKSAEELYQEGKWADEKGQYEKALKYYKKAAKQGHPRAEYQLGVWYSIGKGGLDENRSEAKSWLEKATADGDKDARDYLSSMRYEEGRVEQLRKPAEQGQASAQYMLGLAYEIGNGVEKDTAEAKHWFKKAADQGYEKAIEKLHNM